MKLSSQAIGSIMMALQQCLMSQTDIVPVFQGWDLNLENGELFVENPPIVQVDDDSDEEWDADSDLDSEEDF